MENRPRSLYTITKQIESIANIRINCGVCGFREVLSDTATAILFFDTNNQPSPDNLRLLTEAQCAARKSVGKKYKPNELERQHQDHCLGCKGKLKIT